MAKTLMEQWEETGFDKGFKDKQVAVGKQYLKDNPKVGDADYAKGLLSNVDVPDGYVTYNDEDVRKAMANGTLVEAYKDPTTGASGYKVSGVDRGSVAHSAGSDADRAHFSDAAWLYVYGKGGINEQKAALQSELSNPNITRERAAEIEGLLADLDMQHQAIQYNSGGVGNNGYLSIDGSMHLGRSLFEDGAGGEGGGYGYNSGAYASGSRTGANGYEDYIKAMYDAQRQSALAELNAAYKKNLAAIDRAKVGLEDSYQGARNQTVGASELAKRNFAQYAAANGLNSGTGGQADLARNVTLQGNLNDINLAEGQSLADLDLQRNNAIIEYNNAIAQAEAEGNYELAAALYQEKVRYDNAMTAAIQQEFQNNLSMMQFNAQLGQQAWENWFAKKQYDDALDQQDWENRFKQKQYDDASDQQDWENYLAAMKADKTVEEPVLSWNQLQEALTSRDMSPAAIAAFEAYNKVPYADYVKYGSDFGQLYAAYSIPQDVRNMLERNFPGGYITGDQRWQSWVNRYGEDALRAAGFDHIRSSTVDWAKKVLNANGGDVDYLAYALENTGYTEDQIASILKNLGLLK